jgi:Cu-Zn family superoxide dismutase
MHRIAAVAALATVAGCSHQHDAMHEQMHGHMHGGPAATVTLQPTLGNTATGTVQFEQHGDHVMVMARVTGLKPNQEHGFHVHEKGDCSSPDGMGAGGHFNPTAKPHGSQSADHHAGDMPALKADASGKAEARFHLMGVSVGAGAADLVGRAVVVHADADDYRTQPAGNAGARIACGVVQAASR